jgi:hypothetical protein
MFLLNFFSFLLIISDRTLAVPLHNTGTFLEQIIFEDGVVVSGAFFESRFVLLEMRTKVSVCGASAMFFFLLSVFLFGQA